MSNLNLNIDIEQDNKKKKTKSQNIKSSIAEGKRLNTKASSIISKETKATMNSKLSKNKIKDNTNVNNKPIPARKVMFLKPVGKYSNPEVS